MTCRRPDVLVHSIHSDTRPRAGHRSSAPRKGHPMRPLLRSLLLLLPLVLLAAFARGADAVTYTKAAQLKWPSNFASMDFGDFNNDAFLDLAVCGLDSTGAARTTVYLNTAGGSTWTATTIPLAGVYTGCVRWCDLNMDGAQDLLVLGLNSANQPVGKLYLNNAGVSLNGDPRAEILIGASDYDPSTGAGAGAVFGFRGREL